MTGRTRLPGTPDPMHIWSGADGVRLAADSWGDPRGPLVLLLHGGGQTRHAWGGTGRILGAAGYHAVALDARGHGDSGWSPDADYRHETMVRDLQCVIATLGGRSPVLVGASMGGVVSLIAVGEKHIDVQALILVDVVPQVEADGIARIKAFMGQRPDGFDSLDDVAEAISSYRPTRRRPDTLDGLSKNVRRGTNGKYYWHWDPSYLSGIPDLQRRRARLAACAQGVTVPTLLVRGGSSDVVSEAGAEHFRKLCPHSEYVNVAQAGHMVAGDRNDVFGQAAAAFLMRTVPATAPRG